MSFGVGAAGGLNNEVNSPALSGADGMAGTAFGPGDGGAALGRTGGEGVAGVAGVAFAAGDPRPSPIPGVP